MNLDTHDWEYSHRLRSLFGVEVPLTSRERAWKPKTWYALGGAEPFFGFETHQIDQLRLSAGIGRVLTDRLRVEFTYYSNLTHENMKTLKTTRRRTRRVGIAALVLFVIALAVPVAQAADNKPNVVIIRGDDIGRANI